MNKPISLIVVVMFFSSVVWIDLLAQSNRLRDDNQVGWYAMFFNYKLDEKWSLHGEFQWRRTDWIAASQQNLYRTGINYQLNSQIVFRAGYAFADTFNYGKVPISSNGIRFPEHRSYQMATLSNPIGSLVLSHRFMLEQRWVGRSLDPVATKSDEFVYFNRMRYMFRMDIPLKGAAIGPKEPYLAAYDEVMIGFGKNINQNVFDQNRIALLAGYKFSDIARIEGGYINQVLQFGRLVGGKNLFQHNSGLIILTYINL